MNAQQSGDTVQEPSLLAPRILIPFLFVSLIWGSTWLVIKDQISDVPTSWSVSYRFLVAGAAMFILVGFKRLPFRLGRTGQIFAALIGLAQFSFNFHFVYNAELYITSGLVAVLFALLMVPNAVLGRIVLGQRIKASFLAGSAIAASGIALLLWHEYKSSPASMTDVILGVTLTLCAILSASSSNVMQALPRLKYLPILTLLAWAMFWGSVFNISFAWIMAGPPVIEMRAGYIGGIFYLAIIGTVMTFPLYFMLLREIGAGKAAYSNVLVPVVAMMLSTLFEGYVWTALPAAGALLAIAGLVVALRARRTKVVVPVAAE